MRRRSQSLLPQLGVVVAALGIVLVAPLARFVPRLHDIAPALRILLGTVPLTYLIGVEAHLLSAEDRNKPVLLVAMAALVGNVLLNIGLVPSYAFMGAAVALLITELGQVIGLTIGANAPGARSAASRVIPAVALLILGGALFNVDVAIAAGAALVGAIVIAGVQIRSGLAPASKSWPTGSSSSRVRCGIPTGTCSSATPTRIVSIAGRPTVRSSRLHRGRPPVGPYGPGDRRRQRIR